MKLSNRDKSSLVLLIIIIFFAFYLFTVKDYDSWMEDKEFGAVVQVADCQENGVREYVYWRKDWKLEQELCEEMK